MLASMDGVTPLRTRARAGVLSNGCMHAGITDHKKGNRLTKKSLRRGVLAALFLAVAGCGGGGGGSSSAPAPSPPPATPYANVQPPAAPTPETVDVSQASGVVSVSADSFDPAGRQAGITVELRPILADGSLGAARASATTAVGGSFAMAMPSGTSTADGEWMLVAQAGGSTLRGYVFPGATRVDVGSEAWVRLVAAAAGKVLTFPGAATPVLRSIGRSVALFSDSTGAEQTDQTLDAAAGRVAAALSVDHAMKYVVAALRTSGALPSGGTGDIGDFFAFSETFAAELVDDTGTTAVATKRGDFGALLTPEGNWSFRTQLSTKRNGQLTPIEGAGSGSRLSPSRVYTRLTGSGVALTYLSNAVGEYPMQALPLQPGARQLDARRIERTSLNFTGGTDEQPISFATRESVAGVEQLTIGAGRFRAVRVVNEVQIGYPGPNGTMRTVGMRSTTWQVPGAGLVKESDEALVDGALAPGDVPFNLELSAAYANAIVWPGRVSMKSNFMNFFASTRQCATAVPGMRRIVTVEAGPIRVSSLASLALSLWDMDTGLQIGASRTFTGNSNGCPVAVGTSGSVLVVETFSERNLLEIWPSDAATAYAQSDVVHQISGNDLSDLASYRIAAVPDPAQPSRFHPASVITTAPAPGTSGEFVVGSVMSTYTQRSGDIAQFAQVLGPGLGSLIADLGRVLFAGVDWNSGQIFTSENYPPFTLRSVRFSRAGAVPASARTLKTGSFVVSIRYTSANHLHVSDGSSIRLTDGGDGPRLPYDPNGCGFGAGTLVCLDPGNDRLVRLDPDTLALLSAVPLASYLRSLSLVGPDYSVQAFYPGGLQVRDSSTFAIGGQDIRVGSWP